MENNQPATTERKAGFHPLEFVRETRNEVAKVTWPTRRETLVMTAYIVAMALVVGLFYFGVDSLIGMALSRLLGMKSS